MNGDDRSDLMLKMLRDIRTTLDQHSEEFKTLRKEMHDWHETVATATGFAMHANLRDSAIEADIADLKKRVENLEKSK